MTADATMAPPTFSAIRTLLGRPSVRAFFRSPSGVIGLVIIAIVALDAVLAPYLFNGSAEGLNLAIQNRQPTWAHPLGTDQLGRDLLARTLVGARLSLVFALGTAAVAVVVGSTMGLAVAVATPRLRNVLQRFVDTMIGFPGLLVVVFISTIFGTGLLAAMAGVGVAVSFSFARFVSTFAASMGGRDFVAAARISGIPRRRVMYRHVLPNLAEPLFVSLSFILTVGLLASAALSFLGLGVQPPRYDWGRLLTDGVRTIYLTPAAALGPAVAIAITALAFGFLGEALARAANPLLWSSGVNRRNEPRRAKTTLARAVRDARPSRSPGVVASSTASVLEVEDLVVTFPSREGLVDVIKGVSFSVGPGEIVGIVGESGSGKTMTALAAADLVPYPGTASGSIRLNGHDVHKEPKRRLRRLLGTRLGFVFQDPTSSLNPALSIGRQLTEAPEFHNGLGRAAARRLAVERLGEVGLPVPAANVKKFPHEFSGGMRQRAMIAMGLVNEPSLLVCDEPTTALDVTIQAQIMELLGGINESRDMSILLISHNLALVSQNCDRILVMYAGRIVEELTQQQLLSEPKHPYTKALLGALPDIARARDEPLAFIPGEMPDPASPPSGCAFHPRCPLAMDRCRAERPPLAHREDGRRVACWAVEEGTG